MPFSSVVRGFELRCLPHPLIGFSAVFSSTSQTNTITFAIDKFIISGYPMTFFTELAFKRHTFIAARSGSKMNYGQNFCITASAFTEPHATVLFVSANIFYGYQISKRNSGYVFSLRAFLG
jgi:hypothetical protein